MGIVNSGVDNAYEHTFSGQIIWIGVYGSDALGLRALVHIVVKLLWLFHIYDFIAQGNGIYK